MAEENPSVRLIDAVDKPTHDLIFKVLQKLEGIRAEAGAKIDSTKIDPDLYAPELIDKIKLLHYETDKSLDSIMNLIHTNLGPEVDIEQYRQENGPELANFAEQLKTFVIQATEILNKI